jgi:uncharacterized protein YgbK (DUF1537 family)
VAEKHQGQIQAKDVISIPLAMLREAGPDAVAERLAQVQAGRVCVVNAVSYRDLEVFVAGLLQAEAKGQHFIYRTAASFVRVRGGLSPQALLSTDVLSAASKHGGLIVAGSYIQKSTQQIEATLNLADVVGVEVDVQALLDETQAQTKITQAIVQAEKAMQQGKVALVYTSRQLISHRDGLLALGIGQKVSAALVEIVRGISLKPAWIIAKGGITASDVATKALGIRRAQVLGQAIPGIPIWRSGSESRWPDVIYVVFPGNVGSVAAIADMVDILRA